MWHVWTAAEQPPPEGSQAIIIAVVGGLALVLVAVTTGIFSLLSARTTRTEPAPPSPAVPPDADLLGHLRERLAVVERRADDSDERDEVQDRRLDQLERHADLDNPEWRYDGR